MLRHLMVGLGILALVSTAAFARVDLRFGVDIAPPAPQVEMVPAPRPGYVWGPGYWAWEGSQHVWRPGRWVVERPRCWWVPERWVAYWGPHGPHWHFEPGFWECRHRHRY